MTAQLNPNFKKLLIKVIVAALLTIFLGASTKASTTWTITITAIGNDTKPTYKVYPDHGGCPNQVKQDPEYLHICVGDTVRWQAVTFSDHLHKMSNKLGIFHDDFILLDNADDPTQVFQAVDGNRTDGGKTDKNATLNDEHEYHVSVYDRVNGYKYSDDPTIIIGGTPLMVLIEDLQVDCARLPGAIDHDATENEDLKKQLRDQAARACEQVKKLKDLLPSGPSR
jgi:hypothetical protein